MMNALPLIWRAEKGNSDNTTEVKTNKTLVQSRRNRLVRTVCSEC